MVLPIDQRATFTAAQGERSPKKGSFTVGITRTATNVHLTLSAWDEYSAIELYERLVQSVQNGKLTLDLKSK